MCCIFTCLGWMIDLVQRIWTFAMACCISMAICVLLVSASLSGIALGYNYSLAEYIDLKETNVSVYIKRGMFDDEISDDMEWRRAGHMPVAGHINEDNLVTGAQANPDEIPLRSGRRLDNSVFNSHDKNNFEGSLMKLTAKPVDAPITPITFTPDLEMAQILDPKMDDLNRMKAIQGVLNMRRFNAIAMTSSTESGRRMMSMKETPEIKPEDLFPRPPQDNLRHQAEILSGRRFNPYDPKLYHMLNPARIAVPDSRIGDPVLWRTPYPFLTTTQKLFEYQEIYPVTTPPPHPDPIPLNLGPRRPPNFVSSGRRDFTRPAVVVFTEGRKAEAEKDKDDEGLKSGEETDKLSQKMQQELSRHKSEEYPQKPDEDYEFDDKGLPVRKKRHIESRFSPHSFSSSSSVKLRHSSEMLSNDNILIPTLLAKLMST